MAIPEEITRVPDMSGPVGRAWGIDLTALRTRLKKPPGTDPTVSAWVVEAPWAHPVWHSYLIFAVHLRVIEGLPIPTILRPGSTHQFWVYAADPGAPREPAIRGITAPKRLEPPNFCAQFGPLDDTGARLFVRQQIVSPIIMGNLNPDTDAVSQWIEAFGDDMAARRPTVAQ